jgi:hypothetical protein
LPSILTNYLNIYYEKVTVKKKGELVGALQLGTVETQMTYFSPLLDTSYKVTC